MKKKEKILGIVRHTLTFIGGIVVLHGYADESMIEQIIGGSITLITLIWSVVQKDDKPQVEK